MQWLKIATRHAHELMWRPWNTRFCELCNSCLLHFLFYETVFLFRKTERRCWNG